MTKETTPQKIRKGFKVIGYFISWAQTFSIAMIIGNIYQADVNRNLQKDLNAIRSINSVLISKSISSTELADELRIIGWKKEINPFTEEILMKRYTRPFYNYLLEPMGYSETYYVNKSDFDVFDLKSAQVFYDQDLALYKEWLKQPKDSNGERPLLRKEYKTHWQDLNGDINDKGFVRMVDGKDGRVFIYGVLHGVPDERKETSQIYKKAYLKPKTTKIKREKIKI